MKRRQPQMKSRSVSPILPSLNLVIGNHGIPISQKRVRSYLFAPKTNNSRTTWYKHRHPPALKGPRV